MKVQELHLKNFRGFEDVKIEFPGSNLAVFVGKNGAGKSSALDCIAIFLSLFIENLTRRNDSISNDVKNINFPLKYTDINESYNNTDNNIKFIAPITQSTNMPCFTLSDTIKTFRLGFSEHLPLSHEDVANNIPSIVNTDTIENIDTGKIFTQLIQTPHLNLPVLVYYQTNRTISKGSNHKPSQSSTKYKQLLSYENAFSKNLTNLSDFVSWFKIEEDIENEIKIKKKDFNAVNKNLEIIRNALTAFFILFGSCKFSGLHVQRENREREFAFNAYEKYSLAVIKQGLTLNIEQLSEGERILLLMVSDIARRLAIANPSSDNPLKGCGIVLIDEIDLHLHPQWQRDVIPALLNTFPNIQFIVTTHSPQVLSNVEKDDIRIIEDFKIVEKTPHTKGRDTNSILYELHGVQERPELYKNKLRQLYDLIDDEKIKEAENILKV
jgi:predicted ATP-binding protein involved in virulence